MKKICLSLCLILVSFSVFAATFNINTGAGFSFNSGKIAESDLDVRDYGFDLQLGFNVEFDNHIVVYDNVDFVISPKMQEKSSAADSKWEDSDEVANAQYASRFAISEDAGVGYAFHFDSFRMIAGGGFHADYLLYKFKGDDDISSNVHIGFNFAVQGDYYFNTHWGVFALLKPSITFYDSLLNKRTSNSQTYDETVWGFNGSAVAGATYRF